MVQQDPAAGPRISFIHAVNEARRVRHERKRPLQNLTVQRDKETTFVLAEAPPLPPTPGGRKQGKKINKKMKSHARHFSPLWKVAGEWKLIIENNKSLSLLPVNIGRRVTI